MNIPVPDQVAKEIARLEDEKGIPRETTLKALGEYLFTRLALDTSVKNIVAGWLQGTPPKMERQKVKSQETFEAAVKAETDEPEPTPGKPVTLGVGKHAPSAPAPTMDAPKERFTKQKTRTPETIE